MVSCQSSRVAFFRLMMSKELAFRVAGMVYDETNGDPTTRPREFL